MDTNSFIQMIKNLIKKFIPKNLILFYHKILAILASFFYGYPSQKLIVVGVTGTSGKSTVIYLMSKILEKSGFKVGVTSTIFFKIDQEEKINDKKMTMLGRFALQKLIKKMVKAGCQYALIETTSEGIRQFRHLGINYDIVLFTNLYPEHIESHGSFKKYKEEKLKLFAKLKNEKSKIINGKKIKKIIIANLDNEHSFDFLAHWAEEKYGFTLGDLKLNLNEIEKIKIVKAEDIEIKSDGSKFKINNVDFKINLLGQHNVYNALAAITFGLSQGLSLEKMAEILKSIKNIPGRIEFIDQGQPFKIIVDYAFEPKAITALYEIVKMIPHQKVIHVFGSAGGGRDKWRRPILGEIAAKNCDYIILTNEDPYDEDPYQILSQIKSGISRTQFPTSHLFEILDRRQAIKKAIQLAEANDLILITGKGCEQAIVVKNNKKIPWDDREVVKEELKKISTTKN
ncbi:MAG: Mur ligase family protein [Patescibacteria group bacterium]